MTSNNKNRLAYIKFYIIACLFVTMVFFLGPEVPDRYVYILWFISMFFGSIFTKSALRIGQFRYLLTTVLIMIMMVFSVYLFMYVLLAMHPIE